MGTDAVNFKKPLRLRLRHYAKILNLSDSAFVQECVEATLNLIETPPDLRRWPSIVLRADGGLPKNDNERAAEIIVIQKMFQKALELHKANLAEQKSATALPGVRESRPQQGAEKVKAARHRTKRKGP